LVDDLEDPEGVRSEERRATLKEWFFADVLGSFSKYKDDWKIVVMGTLLHEDSLLANLLEDPNWYHIILQLCDDNYKSNWPDQMSDNKVLELVESYRAQGLLDVFYREYRNMAISTEDSAFMQSYFGYFEETPELMANQDIVNVVIIDPAKTVKLHSAESAVIGIGVNVVSGKIMIRDPWAERVHPDTLYEQAIKMCKELKASVLAVEVTSLNEFITFPLKNAIAKSGLSIEFVELNARASKEDRIAALVPLYRKGQVLHNKANSGPLEAQLLSYPRSKRWDLMDATAYIVELLEKGEMYFLPDKSGKMERDALLKLMQEDKNFDEHLDRLEEEYGDYLIESGRWRIS
jgi:hypothetical protein